MFLLIFLSVGLLITVTIIGYLAGLGAAKTHLAVLPNIAGSKSVLIVKAEETNEKIMLTYETEYNKPVSALTVNVSVSLIATNYTYPFVLEYPVISGGFFSKEAQDNGNRAAVLNKKAAFDIFGTEAANGNEIYIDMKPYIVVGVIDDGDNENLKVFIPSSAIGEKIAECVIVSLDGTSEEQVKNELKTSGIDETRFTFLNLALISSVISGKTRLSLIIAGMGFLIIALKILLHFFKNNITGLKELRQREYLSGLLKDKSGITLKLIVSAVLTVILLSAWFILLLNAAEMLLAVKDLTGVFNGVVISGFKDEINNTQKLYLLSNIFFTAFTAVFTAFTAVALCLLGEKR